MKKPVLHIIRSALKNLALAWAAKRKKCLLKYAVVEKLAKYEDLEEKVGGEHGA